MKIGNNGDGLYFFLLFAPIVFSVWLGDYLRKKISFHMVYESHWVQHTSTIIGIFVEALTILAGIVTGLILIRVV